MIKRIIASAVLACAAGVAHAHQAGMRSLDVPYGEGRIEATLWYPTAASEAARNMGPYAVRVALGAPPVPGRHPLVLVSHGTGGVRLNHHRFAEALARAGFVVASLTHPGDNYQDRSMIAHGHYFYERPRQVSRVLDAVLAHPDWQGMIDAGRIGAIGHSAGGYTVAALLGGTPDPQRLRAHCERAKDDPACAFRDPSIGVAQPAPSAARLPPGSDAAGDVHDARIRAGVLLAPLGTPIAPGSLKASRARIALIAAEHDEVLAARYHADHLRGELPPGSPWRVAKGAGHYSFIAPVPDEWKPRFGPVAVDPAGFDRAAFHEELARELVAFFEQSLK